MVGQLVEVFRLVDTLLPEQVIDVPKITSHEDHLDSVPCSLNAADGGAAVECAGPLSSRLRHHWRRSTEVVAGVGGWYTAGRQWCAVCWPTGVVLLAGWAHGSRPVDAAPEGLTASPGRRAEACDDGGGRLL